MQIGFDPFGIFSIFGAITIIFMIVPILMIIIVVVVFVKICKAAGRTMTLEAPEFAIPESYRSRTRADGSGIRTVRIPTKCPSCGAALSHETIDWVGPLEAKCSYCGAVVRATFEEV